MLSSSPCVSSPESYASPVVSTALFPPVPPRRPSRPTSATFEDDLPVIPRRSSSIKTTSDSSRSPSLRSEPTAPRSAIPSSAPSTSHEPGPRTRLGSPFATQSTFPGRRTHSPASTMSYSSSDSDSDDQPLERTRQKATLGLPASASLARRLSARLPPTPEPVPLPAPQTRKAYFPGALGSTREGIPLVRVRPTKRAETKVAFPSAPRTPAKDDGTDEPGSPRSRELKSDGAEFVTMSTWRTSLAFDVFPSPPRPSSTAIPLSVRTTTYSPSLGSEDDRDDDKHATPTRIVGGLATPGQSPVLASSPSPTLSPHPTPPLAVTPPRPSRQLYFPSPHDTSLVTRKISAAPWEPDILDRMVESQLHPDEDEHERKRLAIAAALSPSRFGLGFAAGWRERRVSSIESDPPSPSPSGDRSLSPSPHSPSLSASAHSSPNARHSAAFSDLSGFSEYEDARSDSPELELPPTLAVTKQQTSLWVLDTIASVGGSDEGNRMSIIGEEDEGEYDGPPSPTRNVTLEALPTSSSPPFDEPPSPTSVHPAEVYPHAMTYAHSNSSYATSCIPPQSTTRTPLARLTTLFRPARTPTRSFSNVGISSSSLGISSSSLSLSHASPTVDDDAGSRRNSVGSWTAETDDGEPPPVRGVGPQGKVGPVVSTPEGKALVGMLEQFKVDERERLRSIATRRVSVV